MAWRHLFARKLSQLWDQQSTFEPRILRQSLCESETFFLPWKRSAWCIKKLQDFWCAVKQYVYTNFSYTFNGFYVHALSSGSCPSVRVLSKQARVSSAVFIWRIHRVVASGGGSVARAPHLKSVPPHFTFGQLVAAYIQYCILKMWPPSGFWPLLLVFGPLAAKSWRRACKYMVFSSWTVCAVRAFRSAAKAAVESKFAIGCEFRFCSIFTYMSILIVF